MNSSTVFSYPKYLLSRCKGKAIAISKRLMGAPKESLFVFGGRAQHWAGMGSELYSNEKNFRNYIQKCDTIIQSLGEKSILANFEKKATADFFEDEANVILTLLSFQIALFELLKSKKILPNAVMGISLGEIAAIYAAGGVSLEGAMKAGVAGTYINHYEKKEFIVLYLQTSLLNANEVSKKSPVPMSVIYEANELHVLAYCHKDDQERAGQFLSSQNIMWHSPYKTLSYPYHTNFLLKHKKAIKEITINISSQPLQCDFYSSVLGTKLPEGSMIENDFWFQLLHKPVCTYSLLQQIAASSYKYFLHVGPCGLSETRFSFHHFSQKEKTASFYTIETDAPELELFSNTVQQLKKIKRLPPGLLSYKKNELTRFLERLNFAEAAVFKNPLPYLNYLQKNGSVYFIPRQNEWIVLDHAIAEYVLKTPEIFSSIIHNSFDEYLLGANPPSHTFVRSLMQPFFTQQRFNMVAQYTSIKANDLLEKLKQKNNFNLVDEFSIPLSYGVLAKFMGFTDEEEMALINTIKQHPYALNFFDDLKEFSKNYLEKIETANESTVGGVLFGFVKENKISFDAAVSLFRLLCVAGTVTTSILVSSAVLLLSQNPALLQQVKDDEQLLNKFIEECLRLEAPESEAKRITTREVELGGQMVPKGAMVVLKLNAINRDPKYFENPDTVNFNRSAKKHLSFSGGYHFCLGAGMARIETKIAIQTILEKFTFLKIDESETEYFPSPHFRALEKLIVLSESNSDNV